MSLHPSRCLVLRSLAAVGLAALAAGTGMVVAAPAAVAAGVGYVRLAHLSPDTRSLDICLLAVPDTGRRIMVPAVGYGAVSGYFPLGEGRYSVVMRDAGVAEDGPVVLRTEVTVAVGDAYTVSAVGHTASLSAQINSDDLALPAAGRAKVRVVHASAARRKLAVSIVDGATIATDVEFTTTTAYKDVDPGEWIIRLRSTDGGTAEVTATGAAGGVYSIFLLDAGNGGNGGIAVQVRADARSGATVPRGGIDTGGGGTADRGFPTLALAVGGSALVAGGWLALLRARRANRRIPAVRS